MASDPIEQLRAQWTDRFVAVDASVPTLARFAGLVGQVMTVNCSGLALVQFFGADNSRYGIDPAHLRITDPPPPPPPKVESPKKPEPPKPKVES